MTAAWLDVVGFGMVVGLLVWTGSRRARRDEEFLLADRSVRLFPLVATLVMTEFNTSTLLAFSAAGYRAGPMAIGLPLVFLVGLTFYTLTVARAWKRFNRLSVAELFSLRYSRSLGRFASALLLLAMTGFSATYVKSLGLIVAPWAPAVPFPALSAALTLAVLLIILPGGLVSVVRSDVVAFIITVVVAPLLLWAGIQASAPHGGLAAAFPADQLVFDPVAQWTHPAIPFRFVSTLVVLTCFTYIAAPWYGQKIFAASSERTAFLAVGCASVLVFGLYGLLLLAAAHFRVVSPDLADAQGVVPAMMAAWFRPGLRGVGFAALAAAAFTTLAGVWTAMAAMVAADFRWSGARRVARSAGSSSASPSPPGSAQCSSWMTSSTGSSSRISPSRHWRLRCSPVFTGRGPRRPAPGRASWSASHGASAASSSSARTAAIPGRGRCTASR
jgi:solute:Na+ symporter, SSS family